MNKKRFFAMFGYWGILMLDSSLTSKGKVRFVACDLRETVGVLLVDQNGMPIAFHDKQEAQKLARDLTRRQAAIPFLE